MRKQLLLLAALALTSWQAQAQTTLSATQDAYVRDGSNAGNTYGVSDPNQLVLKKSNVANDGYSRQAYLRFDLSAITGTVSAAKLRVYGALSDNTLPNIVTQAFSVADLTWTESALTWNNKPAPGSSALASVMVANATAQYYEFDVTSYVAAQKAGGAAGVSFALINSTVSTGPSTNFNSDEAASNKPQLVVTASGGGGGATPTNIVTYAGNAGKEAFNDVVQLSDGTYLVAGVADDLNWINAAVPRIQLAATGINNAQGTGKIGFLLHLSSNLQTINRVVHFAANAVEDILFIKTSNVPGAATGNIYISGNTKDSQANNGGYFIARLNNNFVSGAPTALTWAKSIYAVAGTYIRDQQPWDVGSDNKVIYLTGETHGYNWSAAHRLNASGVQEIVPEWRTHWSVGGTEYHGTSSSYTNTSDPLSYSGIVFKRAGRGDLRSWTQADYDLWQADGNGGTKKGKWPLDVLFSGPFNVASPSDASPGYTGYKPSGIYTYGPSSVAIDRRDGRFFIGMNMKSVLPDGNPDFEPAVIAMASNGALNWWSRLYHEKTPAGDLVNSTPDQYVDGLAIDYTQTVAAGAVLVVDARCHGNNTENYWEGNTVDAVTGEYGFKNQFTGSNGNIHYSWLGKLRISDGQLRASTYVAEATEGNTSWGSPLADPNLDGWFDPNGGWTELNSTRLAKNAVKINGYGSVVVAGTGRRTITTAGAFQKMIKPSAGQSSWNSFVRAYKKDLNNLAYSTIISGTWDPATGAGGDNITINNLFPVTDGVIAVGFHKEGGTAGVAAGNPMPTSSVPAWGSASPSGQSAVLAYYSVAGFYNPGGSYRQGVAEADEPEVQQAVPAGRLRLAPNPAQGRLHVLAGSAVVALRIADLQGRTVLEATPDASGEINISALAPGLYTVIAQTDAGIQTQRLSVQR